MSEYLEVWKKAAKPEIVRFSVGPALVRPNIQLESLVAVGDIPVPLLASLDGVKVSDDGTMALADLPKIMPLLQAVAIASFIDPPLSLDGDENTASLRLLSIDDYALLLSRVMQGVNAIRPFHSEPGQPDNAASGSNDLSPEAEPDNRD